MRKAYMALIHVGIPEKPAIMRAGMGSSHDLDPENGELKALDVSQAAALAVLLGRSDPDYCTRQRAFFFAFEGDKPTVAHRDLNEAELLGCFPKAGRLLTNKKLVALAAQLTQEPGA